MASKSLLADANEKETSRRTLKRRSTEDQVQRLINESFKHLAHDDIYQVKKDGQTLKEALLTERRKLGKNKRISQLVINNLKKKYASKRSTLGKLPKPSQVLPVRAALKAALVRAASKRPQERSPLPLFGLLSTVVDFNALEVYGILKSMEEAPSIWGAPGRTYVMNVMRFLVRCDYKKKWEEMAKACREFFDAALASSLTSDRRGGFKLTRWWRSHRDLLPLVDEKHMPDWEMCMTKEGKSWLPVQEQLRRVVRGSAVGKKALEHNLQSLAREEYSLHVSEVVNHEMHAELTHTSLQSLKVWRTCPPT